MCKDRFGEHEPKIGQMFKKVWLYRFSFIAKEASIDLETGELIKGETKPKRYTYLLGSNEACTTPAKRMLVLADKKEKQKKKIETTKIGVDRISRERKRKKISRTCISK